MKSYLLLLLLTIVSINCYSQIEFEKGYFINNSGQRIECLIKNIDWRYNPTQFTYKLSENTESVSLNINSVKEFGINRVSKYKRNNVKIDRSSENLNSLSANRNPVFEEEELFLKVLIEGKANLYMYEDRNVIRFFYNTENSSIEQLVFKSYYKNKNLKGRNYYDTVGKNNRFKQQLLNNLKCSSISIEKIEKLKYRKKDLINLFIEYNSCNNTEVILYDKKLKKDLFNLTLRPRLKSSSAYVENRSFDYPLISDFGNKQGIGIGIETEFILLFNKSKWSIFFEIAYGNYKSNKTIIYRSFTSTQHLDASIKYNFIEVPIGFRHYFYVNDNSKFFANLAYIIDFSLNSSSIDFKRTNNTTFTELDVDSNNMVGFGLGYKYKDSYSLEARYITDRLLTTSSWKSEYKTASLIFGYSFL